MIPGTLSKSVSNGAYSDGKGGTAIQNNGGFAQSLEVVLDFADGSRRVIPVLCPSGYPLRDCEYYSEGGVRAGQTPGF